MSPTIGFKIHTLESEGFHIHLWDIGGQKTIRSFWRNYFEQTDAVIWVIDLSDMSRWDECRRELLALLVQDQLQGSFVMVLANKLDMAAPKNLDLLRAVLDVESIKSHHIELKVVSALENLGISQSFKYLLESIKASR